MAGEHLTPMSERSDQEKQEMIAKTSKIIKALVDSREILEGELIRYYHVPPEDYVEETHKSAVEDCINNINKALEEI